MNVILMDDNMWFPGNFDKNYILDSFESLIWTERYVGYGDFEFYTPMNQNTLDIVEYIRRKTGDYYGLRYDETKNIYAVLQETGTPMFVEKLQITTDTETGDHLIISGRGLETILERRIIYKTIALSGNIQDCFEKLLNDSIISPEDPDRQIENFIFVRSDNSHLNNLTIDMQCSIGDNLYDVFLKACEAHQVGFNVYINQDNKFAFTLTYGENRARQQVQFSTNNPMVMFSPKYDNMLNSEYLESCSTFKSSNLVVGDDQYGLDNVITINANQYDPITGSSYSLTGISRREMYTDASDIDFSEQYKPVEEDKEALEDYRQKLSDTQTSLANVQKEQNEKTAEHNQKVEGYTKTKTEYQNRETALDERIKYYNNQKKKYKERLDSAQKTAYENREKDLVQVEKYDKLIKEDDAGINEWNDAIQNDMTMDYLDLVNYEETIIAYEEEKEEYQTTKTEWENKQKAEEEKLPNFEEELKMYEDMISKYKGVIANDKKSVQDLNAEEAKELADYNAAMTEYGNTITSYNNEITNLQNSISSLEEKMYWDIYDLNEQYINLLSEKGQNELSENTYTRAFTSEIDASKTFVYGKDFFMGDIVEVMNEYGLSDQARITEIVRTEDSNGISMYPTFQILNYGSY